MKKEADLFYVKRTQRDYTLSFKLQVLSEVESEELSIKGALHKYGIQSHGTVLNWVRKYGTFDREYQLPRLGTRKLYHMLQEPLQVLHIGRDNLFT